jgi:DNA polymerase-3 subunit delta
MKFTQIKPFEKHLDSSGPSHFSPIYALLIKDERERLWMLDRCKQKLLESGMQLHMLPREQTEKHLFEELASLPLFREKKLVCCPLDDLSKQKHEAMIPLLASASRDTRYVFFGESLPKSSPLLKAFEVEGVILELIEEKPWEKEKAMTEWLLYEAEKGKKRISYQAVNALVKGSKRSFAYLSGEWEKLCLYAGNRESIEDSDLEAISTLEQEENTWGLGDALLQRDGKKALEIAFFQLDQGAAVIQILRQMRHQMQTTLKTALHQQEGSMADWIAQNPYLKGSILDKQLKGATSYGISRLCAALQLIDQYEFKAKDSLDQPKLLITQLIGRLT